VECQKFTKHKHVVEGVEGTLNAPLNSLPQNINVSVVIRQDDPACKNGHQHRNDPCLGKMLTPLRVPPLQAKKTIAKQRT